MGRRTDGPTERQLGEVGPEGMMCKRGLTRDACLGGSNHAAGGGGGPQEGDVGSSTLSATTPPTPPGSPFPHNGAQSPRSPITPSNVYPSPPPVALSRLDDSTCQPAPPTPPSLGPPFSSLSFSLSFSLSLLPPSRY